jgi:hypothetical protein
MRLQVEDTSRPQGAHLLRDPPGFEEPYHPEVVEQVDRSELMGRSPLPEPQVRRVCGRSSCAGFVRVRVSRDDPRHHIRSFVGFRQNSLTMGNLMTAEPISHAEPVDFPRP